MKCDCKSEDLVSMDPDTMSSQCVRVLQAEVERLEGLLAAAHRDAEVGGRVIEGRHKAEVERSEAEKAAALDSCRWRGEK